MTKEDRTLYIGLAMAAIPLFFGRLLEWPARVVVPLLAAAVGFGVFTKLTGGLPTPSDHVGMLLDQLGLHGERNAVRRLAAHRFARSIEAAGHPQVAEDVRRRFNTPGEP
ncbi:hypothetical protein E1202_24535 [Saccharopolyspora karakumensis]|uniref:Uncharacterized protein n=1 Tax=Saccharopolyspora karakumensis TaxID=2530386 RepID=A0A4V2YW33_9PSEU|nr:hypothetical protein [Saccharopolyspora karakumensis]TDD83877.1 hypothetical protein E1202_24535 [Saccharopolyspora karakumensis]